jgi:hypothetical protein
MKMQRIAIVVTIINLVLMVVLLTKVNPATAQKQQMNKLQVLRGSGLEITDSSGKLRASISFHAAVEQDGKMYPAGVLLRLINTKGQPSVKIGASEEGGGLNFSNEKQGYIQMLANENGGFLKIKNPDGKEQVVKP